MNPKWLPVITPSSRRHGYPEYHWYQANPLRPTDDKIRQLWGVYPARSQSHGCVMWYVRVSVQTRKKSIDAWRTTMQNTVIEIPFNIWTAAQIAVELNYNDWRII